MCSVFLHDVLFICASCAVCICAPCKVWICVLCAQCICAPCVMCICVWCDVYICASCAVCICACAVDFSAPPPPLVSSRCHTLAVGERRRTGEPTSLVDSLVKRQTQRTKIGHFLVPETLFEEYCDHKLWWSRLEQSFQKKSSTIGIQDPTI